MRSPIALCFIIHCICLTGLFITIIGGDRIWDLQFKAPGVIEFLSYLLLKYENGFVSHDSTMKGVTEGGVISVTGLGEGVIEV